MVPQPTPEFRIAQLAEEEGKHYVITPDGCEPLYVSTLETALRVARDYDKDDPTRILVHIVPWIKELKKATTFSY
jgi:hypothetical protein